MTIPLALLIVEDVESDAQLIVRLLKKAGYELLYEQVDTAEQMRVALEKRTWDAVISDYSLPQFDGRAALELLKERGQDIPFIVVSGTIGEETAVAMMRAGAHDYVMKGDLTRLVPAVERELKQAQDRRTRKQAQDALRKSQEHYLTLFDNMLDGIYRSTNEGKFVDVNPAMINMFGYSSREEMLQVDIRNELYFEPEERESHILDTGQEEIEVYRMRRKDGSEIWVEDHVHYVHDEQGRVIYHEGILRDITVRKQAEEALWENEAKYKVLFESVSDAIFIYDPETFEILHANEATSKLYGYDENELIGLSCLKFSAEVDQSKTIASQITKDGQATVLSRHHKKKDGSDLYVQLTGYKVIVNGHDVMFTVCRDITERKQIEDTLLFLLESGYSEENFFQSLARYLATSLDMDYVCIDRLSGDQLSAQTVAVYFDGNFDDNVEYSLKDTPCGDVVGKNICVFPNQVRHLFPQDVVLQEMLAESYIGTTLWDTEGQPIGLIAIISRKPLKNSSLAKSVLNLVSMRAAGELGRKQTEEELIYLSTHDVLTGLYNRTFFVEEMARLERGRSFPVSIVMADVDRLKEINDREGHAAGDALLKRVAQTLTVAFRTNDMIARIGGDEFAVLLPNTDANAAEEILRRVRQVILKHNTTHAETPIRLSIGVSTTEEQTSLSDVLNEADENMYREKRGNHAAS